MKNKEKYLQELKQNNGYLNEIDLGEKIGFNENETREIISQLLSEHKITYTMNNVCNYQAVKK